jgi:hypothetical protein
LRVSGQPNAGSPACPTAHANAPPHTPHAHTTWSQRPVCGWCGRVEGGRAYSSWGWGREGSPCCGAGS